MITVTQQHMNLAVLAERLERLWQHTYKLLEAFAQSVWNEVCLVPLIMPVMRCWFAAGHEVCTCPSSPGSAAVVMTRAQHDESS